MINGDDDAPTDREVRQGLALELMRVIQAVEMVRLGADEALKGLLLSDETGLGPDDKVKALDVLQRGVEAATQPLVEEVGSFYRDSYSADELRQLLTFYHSPLGQLIISRSLPQARSIQLAIKNFEARISGFVFSEISNDSKSQGEPRH